MNTPVRQFTNINKVSTDFSPALLRVLQENEKQKKIKVCLKWGTINLCLLLIIIYDLSYACPLSYTYTQIAEYFLVIVLSLNFLYYFFCYPDLVFKSKTVEPSAMKTSQQVTPPQQISNTVNPFSTPGERLSEYSMLRRTPTSSFSSTPINMSAASWRSTPGSMYSPFHRNSPHEEIQPVDNLLQPNTSGIENIKDPESLSQYLNSYEEYDKISNVNKSLEQSNLLNTFWSYPGMKSLNETSPMLRRTQYQLSFLPASSSGSPGNNPDEKGSPQSSLQNLEIWKQINVDNRSLTRWTGNLRSWISKTILERIVSEITSINEHLEKNGLTDVCVGRASLDSLRKTSQTAAVLQFAPTLPTLVPFLELTSNQEYLIKRIKDLGKSGSMSDYRWNGGSSFKGKEWDDSLPTDSEIIMHLFVSYMDTQLFPLPNKPDEKPFSSNHFIKFSEKSPEISASTIAIRENAIKPPQYHVIVGDKIFEIPKGHNNLFHAILLFLFYVNERELGMLGRVNLGRSGVNMLWILQR